MWHNSTDLVVAQDSQCRPASLDELADVGSVDDGFRDYDVAGPLLSPPA
jgi:hypothetical protein